MGTNRAIWDGIPEGLNGDRTTTGAYAISSLPNFSTEGIGALRHGDKTTPCPDCGQAGELIGNIPFVNLHGRCAAGNGAVVICGCPPGSNYLISPAGPVGKSRLQSTRIVGQPDPVQHAQATHSPPHRQPANQHEEALPTTCACNRDITMAEFRRIATGANESDLQAYLDLLNLWMPWNGITTCRAKAHFLAQVCGETGSFSTMVEGGGQSQAYAPYYGRGIMQLTHDYNYRAYDNFAGINSISTPRIIESAPHSFMSGFWVYGTLLNLVSYGDNDDFNFITAKINGGFNGYDVRLSSFDTISTLLKAEHLNIKKLNRSFSFSDSEIYNYRVYAFEWGKWHDPGLHSYVGTSKDVSKALEGYRRALTLYETHNDHHTIHLINTRINALA